MKLKLFLIPLFVLLMAGSAWANGNDANTVSLLHMNGVDESTTFTDDAAGGTHTWTAAANAQIDTAQYKFSGSSALFDGSSRLTAPDSADWDFGTDDFTIDFWVRWPASVAAGGLVGRYSAVLGTWAVQYSGGNLYSYYDNGTAHLFAWTPSGDTWYHVAIARSGTNLKAFVDGTQIGTTKPDSVDYNTAEALAIGNYTAGSGQYFTGYIDELRISKGIARWTTDFTPPAAEYSESAGAVLMTKIMFVD